MSDPATRTADEAIAGVSEFPERLGPVLIKELRQGLRSGLFVIPFLVLPAVLALVAVWALSSENRSDARSAIGGFFWVAVVVPVVLITPLRALGSIRSEREAQTLDLLQLTPLTAWRIVFAKWSSLVVQSLLWVVALLPFFILRYFFGNVNLTEEFFQLVIFVLCGAALTAVAMVISTLPRLMFWLCIAGLAFVTIWTLGFSIISLFNRSIFSGIFGASAGGLWQMFLIFDGVIAHIALLALMLAASRIAPQADNYAARLRLGALSLFAWWGIAALALPHIGAGRDSPWFFFAVGVVALTLLGGYELVSERQPLAVHVKPWTRFGFLGRALGRCFMPGWPSSALFSSAIALLAELVVLTHVYPPLGGTGNDSATAFAIVTGIFAWCALVLPRGIQCMFRRRGIERPVLHLLLHLAGGLLAIILGVFTIVLGEGVVVPGALFPSTLFWLVITEAARWRDAATLLGCAGAVWLVVLGAVLVTSSRGYWKNFRARAAPAVATK